MSENEDAIIGWDDEVSNDGNTLLPDGDEVEVTVAEVERGYCKDGSTPQVKLTFTAESLKGYGTTTIVDYIKMTRKSEWKLCELFTALGLRKHGERLKLRWDLNGMKTRATVSVDTYTGRDGDLRKSNKIKKYLGKPAVVTETVEDGEFA